MRGLIGSKRSTSDFTSASASSLASTSRTFARPARPGLLVASLIEALTTEPESMATAAKSTVPSRGMSFSVSSRSTTIFSSTPHRRPADFMLSLAWVQGSTPARSATASIASSGAWDRTASLIFAERSSS